jgi:hypothetical protein
LYSSRSPAATIEDGLRAVQAGDAVDRVRPNFVGRDQWAVAKRFMMRRKVDNGRLGNPFLPI